MSWVWPFNWYKHIKALEAQNAALLKEARRWEGVARAAAVAQCGITAAYVAAIGSLASSMVTDRKVGCGNFTARDAQGYCSNCGYHRGEHL